MKYSVELNLIVKCSNRVLTKYVNNHSTITNNDILELVNSQFWLRLRVSCVYEAIIFTRVSPNSLPKSMEKLLRRP